MLHIVIFLHFISPPRVVGLSFNFGGPEGVDTGVTILYLSSRCTYISNKKMAVGEVSSQGFRQ